MIRTAIAVSMVGLALSGCASGRHGPPPETKAPEGPRTLKQLTVEERRHVMERARVWQSVNTSTLNLITGPALPASERVAAQTTCTYVHPEEPLSGNTPKFQCAIAKGDEVKVKYGQANGEVYAEVAASRLFWALGFKADTMLPARVTCINCPVDPFAAGTTDWRSKPPTDLATRVFDPAVIERDLRGKKVAVPGYEGWAWPELDQVRPSSGATRAHLDALKLLAVFIQHSDSKPDQQAIVCERGHSRTDAEGNETCRASWLVIKDLGATFGKATRLNSSKMILADWDSAGVWKVVPGGQQFSDAGPAVCIGNLPRSLTGSLEDPRISEAGRRFLSRRLAMLSDRQIRDLFTVSQIEKRGEEIAGADGRRRKVTVADWVRVFKRKRSEIAAAQCQA
ncbi:MAG: hypothetical protein Q8O42_22220 [Acidobacteriota bacterium]|nr:hypothetical protein [Acidobacteriota bacterium]